MRLRILGGLFAAGLLGQHSAAAQTTPATLPPLVSSTVALKEGAALHDEGKYSEALAKYRAVPSSDTSYARVQSEMALSYYLNKQYKEAIAASERVLLLGEPEPQTYNVLASAQEELLGPAQALKTYQTGLQRYPYSQLLWYNQALTQNKAGQVAEAFASLQRSLELHPTHAGTHLLLGQLAARQGQTTHAMLSLMTFLAVDPSGEQSNGALVLLEQLASHATRYDEKEQLPALFPNAELAELDQLIDAKIALRKEYTTPVKFDANLVKQVQLLVEKFPSAAPASADFWLRAYGPLVAALQNQETRTAFTYLILSSAGDDGGRKWVKSNDSKIDKMIAAVQPAVLAVRHQQPVAHKGYPARMAAWFDENGNLYGLGDGEKVNGEVAAKGPWLLIGYGGALQAEGSFSATSKKTGPWRYYYANGTLERACSYDEQELLTGDYLEYHDNGALSVSGTYRAGQPEGVAKLYTYCGAVRETRTYEHGNLEGPLESFYADGKLEARSTFHADLKQGLETGYYPEGTVEYEFNFVDGKRQGLSTVYSRQHQPERKSNYLADKLHGTYTEYFDNGQVAQTGDYTDDKQTGTWKTYFRNGQLSEVENYDQNGENHGLYQDYEDDGKLASEFQYEHGKVVSVAFFDKAGKELSRTAVRKGATPVRGLFPNGATAYTGTYQDGRRHGEWRWLRHDGSVRLVRPYVDGKLHGFSDDYYRNGQLQSRKEYQDGIANGQYSAYFEDGQLQQTGHYRNGEQEGKWQDFYVDGTLSEEYNLHEGESQGFDYSYSPTGKLTEERRAQNNRLLSLIAYDSTGQVMDRIELRPDSKSYTLRYPNGKPRLQQQISCFQRHGTYTYYGSTGTAVSEATYRRNQLTGVFRSLHANGKVNLEGRYEAGQREGEWKAYYANGQLRSRTNYRHGEEDGEQIFYFENGKPDMVRTYQDGEIHGSTRQYNLLGELLLERVYSHSDLSQYRPVLPATAPTADGLRPVPTGQTFDLNTQFANGKPAVQEHYTLGYMDGVRTLYYSTGQVYRRSEVHKGVMTGLLTTYYPDGKKMEEEQYLHDELHGRCRYYRPTGVLEREETYRAGEKVGPTVYYDASGKPIKTELYWNSYVYGTK